MLVRQGIHVLVVDLFLPTRRDPQGIRKAIWDEFQDEDVDLTPGKPLTVAAFDARPPVVAYVESFGVGDPVPDMPLFLRPEFYVVAPLDSTYRATWTVFPTTMKRLLESHGDRPDGTL
jgi:hypothetical protein